MKLNTHKTARHVGGLGMKDIGPYEKQKVKLGQSNSLDALNGENLLIQPMFTHRQLKRTPSGTYEDFKRPTERYQTKRKQTM